MPPDSPRADSASSRRARRLIKSAQAQVEAARICSIGHTESSRAVERAATSLSPYASIPGYDITREIHHGGQGVVYEAVQKSTRRAVAVKVMREGPFSRSSSRVRFEREVQILGQLRHPNIVNIHDSGLTGDCSYFVMDYIEGQALDDFVAGLESSEGAADVKSLLRLFFKICEAVNAAHLRGVIHRDLKPSNIRVDQAGEPHILDFGLAKVEAEGAFGATATMTGTGEFIGSLPWASPEQAEGGAAGVDLRTDVYSLGVIFYQVLTGRFPYAVVGPMRTILENIAKTPPIPPSAFNSEIDNEVETIVLKCLSKEPDRRYQSAGELGRDLHHYLAGEPIAAKRDSTMYMLRVFLRRHRFGFSIAAGFLLLLTASSAVAWLLYAAAERSAHNARGAERIATDRLWDSYLAQARAGRGSNRPGRRFDSLAVLRKAAGMRPSLEVRNEAIACMAITDLRITRQWKPELTYRSAAFDEQLEHYALGLPDGVISIRGVADDSQRALLAGFGVQPVVLRFSPHGRLLAVKYHQDETIRFYVWDWPRAETCLEITGCRNWKSTMAFDSASRYLAVSLTDHSVHVYDLQEGREWKVFSTSDPSGRVEFAPRSLQLAVAAGSNVEVFDVEQSEKVRTFGNPDTVLGLAWSADGTRLAATCRDFRVYVWDNRPADTGSGPRASRPPQTMIGHGAEVSHASFGRDGDLLATRAWDGTSRLWETHTGNQLLVADLGIMSAGILDQGSLVPVTRDYASFGLAELATGHECRTLHCHGDVKGPVHADISPDGMWMASSGDDGVRLWCISTGREVGYLPLNRTFVSFFDPSGRFLLTAGDHGLHRWPLTPPAAPRVDVEANGLMKIGPPEALWSERDMLRWAAQSQDGRTLVIMTRRGQTLMLHPDSNVESSVFTEVPSSRQFSLSPDGRLVASLDQARQALVIFDLQAGRALDSLPAKGLTGSAFSPDGRRLVISSPAECSTWEVENRRQICRMPQVTGSGSAVAISRNGMMAAVAVSGEKVRLFEIATGREVATLEAPTPPSLTWLCFSPDGDRLAAVGFHKIQLWDLRSIRGQLADMGLDWD